MAQNYIRPAHIVRLRKVYITLSGSFMPWGTAKQWLQVKYYTFKLQFVSYWFIKIIFFVKLID